MFCQGGRLSKRVRCGIIFEKLGSSWCHLSEAGRPLDAKWTAKGGNGTLNRPKIDVNIDAYRCRTSAEHVPKLFENGSHIDNYMNVKIIFCTQLILKIKSRHFDVQRFQHSINIWAAIDARSKLEETMPTWCHNSETHHKFYYKSSSTSMKQQC